MLAKIEERQEEPQEATLVMDVDSSESERADDVSECDPRDYCRGLKRKEFATFDGYWEERLRRAERAGFSFSECAFHSLQESSSLLRRMETRSRKMKADVDALRRKIRERLLFGERGPTPLRGQEEARRTPRTKKIAVRVPSRRTFRRTRRAIAGIKRGWPKDESSENEDDR